jgi:Terminase RNaseH-like domain
VGEDLSLLLRLGRDLEWEFGGRTVRDFLIESLLQIRPKAGGIERIRLNRAQQQYSRDCGKRNIVLKARQLGITTYIAARFFVQAITRPGTVAVQVAHTQESAEALFTIVRRFWEKLPDPLRRGVLLPSRANVRQLAFPRLDSEYRVETADANAGRGMTIHYLHCSEVSRWPRDASETLASLRAAVAPEGEVVLESTPNGAAGVFYNEWQKSAEIRQTQHFFPWWFEKNYRQAADAGRTVGLLTPEETLLRTEHGLDDQQISWRRTQWASLSRLARQEYAEDANTCFLTSGECVFDLEAIEKAGRAAAKLVESQDNERLLIWFPPQPARQYIIGVDAAGGGTDGDYACAEVIDRETGMQCAELRGHFPPMELAHRVVELARTYSKALLVVERNNHGYGVLAHLRDSNYENIFLKGEDLGWLTSAATKPAMIENMVAIIATDAELFHSRRLLEECRTFVRRADGSASAADGAHDDCVMAMAIALQVRKEVAGRRTGRGR